MSIGDYFMMFLHEYASFINFVIFVMTFLHPFINFVIFIMTFLHLSAFADS